MKKKLLGLALSGLILAGTSVPVANALPGQCFYSPFGGFCDTAQWPDGSYQHCESAMGFSNCFRACHDPVNNGRYPTDYDPNTPC